MKKLIIISMLAISFIATAQTSKNRNLNFKDILVSTLYKDLIIASLPNEVLEEEDAPFDFNTADYLPIGFNPFARAAGLEFYEVSIEEEDEPFDFDTKKYLPKGFDHFKGMFLEEPTTIDDEVIFDFNTAAYLPLGFNPYAKKQRLDFYEASIEQDTPFDFNIKEYLPSGFDPYKGIVSKEYIHKVV